MRELDFMSQQARDSYYNLSFSQLFQYNIFIFLQLIIMRMFVSIYREHFMSALSG